MNKRHHAHSGRDLTTGSIPEHMIKFSLPMLIGSFLQVAYSFVNAIWVGQFLGTNALAAVTVSFPVLFALMALGGGLTLATNILVAQHFGAKRFEQLRRVVDSSTVLIAVVSLTLTMIGLFLSPHILKAMNTPNDVYPIATTYLRITLLSLPFGFGLFLVRSMQQGIGDSKTPLYFQGASLIFMTILDPILIFGLIGFPKLGLNGTAWASLIAQFGALVSIVIYLKKKDSIVALRLRRLHFDWETTWITIKIGIPSALQQSLVSIGMVVITSLVNGFGELATAAFGAASRIDQIAFMPAMSFGMASSTLAGQNIGAKKFDRVNQIMLWGCIFSGVVTLTISLIAASFPHYLLKIFVQDENVIQIGVGYLHIVATCYIFFAMMFISNGIINGSGHTLVTTFISLVSLWAIRVPLANYLSSDFQDVRGIWYAISLSFFIAMSISFAYYFIGKWKKPIARRTTKVTAPESVFGEETGEA